jgi:thiamine-phosphate diphosphorylase
VEAVRLAVEGGCTIIQLREKDIDGGDFIKAAKQVLQVSIMVALDISCLFESQALSYACLLPWHCTCMLTMHIPLTGSCMPTSQLTCCHSLLQVCRPKGIPVIINDRIDVALASGADGVHVGQADIPANTARQLLGPGKILGVSVKTPDEARQAQADGADYVGCGAVFPTSTKDSSVIGVKGLAAVCAAVDIPVVSIGGVGISNAAETIKAGCAGVAVVSAVFGVAEPVAASKQLREVVDAALQQRVPASAR